MKKTEKLWMGFDIVSDKKSIFKPQKIRFWSASEFEKAKPQKPFLYKADALLGLSLKNLHPISESSTTDFSLQAWENLDPHWHLYQQTQQRAESLQSHQSAGEQKALNSFETNFQEILKSAFSSKEVDLTGFADLINSIDEVEKQLKKPLLYNFSLKNSDAFLQTAHFLYSALFHLRAVMGIYYNSEVLDSAFESVRMDSISDYIPRAEYVANDALIFYSFVKQLKKSGRQMDAELDWAFKKYSSNGVCLLQNIPQSFLKKLSQAELEEVLFMVQMDWLLGSSSGLLFKIREELYGLREGYDQIFWPHAKSYPRKKAPKPAVNFFLTTSDLFEKSAA
jgi:hypothetical protein